MAEDRATSFLQMIRRSQRGRLKIYLGYGPGVGKTYQMLTEAQRLKAEGVDVVVGIVETHGRVDTAKLVEGLDVMPRQRMEYHGITVEEMDVDAILARKPQVVLVDELAHTNVPGNRNGKRYQDVQEILAAGIHVISTMNVQHLESLYNTVEKLIGVKVRERLPDSVLAEADEVVNIDLAAQDLQKRLEDGKVYPTQRVSTALGNFFTTSNLEHLRELTLRELASQLDLRRRDVGTATAADAPDQIMVCLSSRGPNSARLLRFASRLAGRLNRNWYAVYVQTPSEDPITIDATTQRLLSDTLTLANQLGAMVFTFKGQDVVDTVIRFAREYRVGHIVIGRPGPLPWWRRLLYQRSIIEELVERARGISVVVVDAESDEPLSSARELSIPASASASASASPVPAPAATPAPVATPNASVGARAGADTGTPPAKQAPARLNIANLLTPQRIVIWDSPVSRQDAIQQLVAAIGTDGTGLDLQATLGRLDEREKQGSTFLNEGVALPHARVPGLTTPQIALGLPHAGISDAPAGKPIEAVFLLLSPEGASNAHLHLLAAAGRALQGLDLRRKLQEVGSSEAALATIQNATQNT